MLNYLLKKSAPIFSFLKGNIFLVSLIFVSMISYNHFLLNMDILAFDDFIFHYNEELREVPIYPMGWLGNTNMGVINGQPFFYPIELLEGILARLGFGWNILERVFYFWPIIFVAPIASFLFFKTIIKSKIGAWVASLLYSYNTYFLVNLHYGFLNILLAGILAPLFLLFLIKYLEKNERRFLLGAIIVGFIITAYDFRVFYALGLMCFLYFLIFFIVSHKKETLIHKAIHLAVPFGVILLFNSFWLIGFFSNIRDYDNILDRGFQTVWSHNLLSALALHHPYYGAGITLHGGLFNVAENIRFYFWLIPMLAAFGFILNRKKLQAIVCTFVTLFFILIAKQDALPFPDFFKWLYYAIPGFNAFREAGKFYIIVALGYSILAGSLIKWLWDNWKNGKLAILKYFITFTAVTVFLFNAVPLARGVYPIFKPKEVPRDYLIFKEFIVGQPEYFSVLWVPNASKHWSAVYNNNHPSLGLVSLIRDWKWKKFSSQKYKNGAYPYENEVVGVLNQDYADGLLDMSSVKYVAIQLNDPQLTESFIDLAKMHGTRDYFEENLDSLDYLKRIDIGAKEMIVYENKSFKPLIYISKEKETIFKKIYFQEVAHTAKNSAEYNIFAKNIKEPFYINFSQSYHPGWKLRAGNLNWTKAILDKNYFFEDNYHFENDAALNSFALDPNKICQSNSACKQNPDGSYNIDLILFFKPQSYLYLGLVIALISIFGFLLVLILSNFAKGKI